MPEKEEKTTQSTKDNSSHESTTHSKDSNDETTNSSLSKEINSLKEELKQQSETNKQETEDAINKKNDEINQKEEKISSLEKTKDSLSNKNDKLESKNKELKTTIDSFKKEQSEQKMHATEVQENKDSHPTDSSGLVIMLVGGTALFCALIALFVHFIRKQYMKWQNNTPIDKETFMDELHKIPYVAVNDLDYQIEIFGVYNEIKEKTNDDNFDFQSTVLLTGKRVIANIQKNGEFYCDSQYDDVYHLCERYSKYLKKEIKSYKPKH